MRPCGEQFLGEETGSTLHNEVGVPRVHFKGNEVRGSGMRLKHPSEDENKALGVVKMVWRKVSRLREGAQHPEEPTRGMKRAREAGRNVRGGAREARGSFGRRSGSASESNTPAIVRGGEGWEVEGQGVFTKRLQSVEEV